MSADLLDRPIGAPTDPALDDRLHLDVRLDPVHEAHQPPEAEGRARDDVRLLVSNGDAPPVLTTFGTLPSHLRAGDLLVVNTSATVAAAVDVVLEDRGAAVLHLSTELPGGLWLVELRRRLANGSSERLTLSRRQRTVRLADGTPLVHLLRPAPESTRLWLAVAADGVDLSATMARLGRPIRYRYVPQDWPLEAYQTVFATDPGSAEMPSAARPFTTGMVTELVSRGIGVSPITLHTGVASLEAGERPYTERYHVPAGTAALVNATHASGGHVVAVGTTVVRALETVADDRGVAHPGQGWTDVVVTPSRGVRVVDGLLTGWHEPEASHLAMLEAIAGRQPLLGAYRAAFDAGFRWHEFGDSHLLLPYA